MDEKRGHAAELDAISIASSSTYTSSSIDRDREDRDRDRDAQKEKDYADDYMLDTDYSSSTNTNSSSTRSALQPARLALASTARSLTDVNLNPAGRARALLLFVVPSFLRARVDNQKPHLYTHLDGLRGIAALIVVIFHSTYWLYEPYAGYNTGPGTDSWVRLPFMRLIFHGHAMVSMFFVLSGFVLSVKPLSYARKGGQFGKAAAGISSSAFRRFVRLYLPCVASTFIITLCMQAGLYDEGHIVRASPIIIMREFQPRVLASLFIQIRDWTHDMFQFMDVFHWDRMFTGTAGYDVHLWTIPIEFHCSMVLFMTQIVMIRMRTTLRVAALVGLWWFCLYNNRWDLGCFLTGAFAAEVDAILRDRRAERENLDRDQQPSTVRREKLTKAANWAVLVAGLYILSCPVMGAVPYGFHWMENVMPDKVDHKVRTWFSVGGAMVCYAVNVLPVAQRALNWAPIYYLGKVSFPLYLMHGPVLQVVLYPLVPFLVNTFCGGMPADDVAAAALRASLAFRLVFGFDLVLTLVLVLWASDLFWRGVDVPSQRWSKWLEARFFVE